MKARPPHLRKQAGGVTDTVEGADMESVQIKRCSTCLVEKPLTEFPLRALNRDGHCGRCRECHRVDGARRRASARAVEKQPVTSKVCTKCGVEQPASEFQKKSATKDGLQQWCKSCFRARWNANPDRNARNAAAYRAAHKEELRVKKLAYCIANRDREAARARAWSARNPERKRAAALKWEQDNPERAAEMRRFILQRRESRKRNLPTYDVSMKDRRRLLSGPCAVAGCQNTDIQIDHIIPVARGGLHGIGNFQALCASHNQSKSDRLWIEFRVYLKRKAELAA